MYSNVLRDVATELIAERHREAAALRRARAARLSAKRSGRPAAAHATRGKSGKRMSPAMSGTCE